MVGVPECVKRVYASTAYCVSQVGKCGGKLASPISNITENTDRTMYFLQCMVGICAAALPNTTLAGRVAMFRFAGYLEVFGVCKDVQNFMDTPLKSYTNRNQFFGAWKKLVTLVVDASALLNLADQINLLSTGKLASEIGRFAVFGKTPFQAISAFNLHTVFLTASIVQHTLAICDKLWTHPSPATWNRALYLECAYDVSVIALRVTMLGGATLFPAHYVTATGVFTLLTATLGFLGTYTQNV